MEPQLSFRTAEDNPLKPQVKSSSRSFLLLEPEDKTGTRSSPLSLLNGEKLCIRVNSSPWPEGALPITLFLSVDLSFPAFLYLTNFRVMASQLIIKPEDRSMFASKSLRADSFEVPLLALSKCERSITRESCFVDLHVKDGRNISFSHAMNLNLRQSLFDTIYEGAFSTDIRCRFAYSHFVVSEENGWQVYNLFEDFSRFGVNRDGDSPWMFLDNSNGEVCDSYPDFIVTPRMSRHELLVSSQYRAKNRMPAMVWRSFENSATLWRSAQFKAGFANTKFEDEKCLGLIADSTRRKQLLIADTRTPQSLRAVGVELKSHYPFADVVFLGLPTIQATNTSWRTMLTLCNTVDSNRFLTALESAGWIELLSLVIKGTLAVVDGIASGIPVLVHCVEGWDQTTQICSLSQLCLDPHYRTVRGFAQLIEKDWLSFGHQFELRLGHGNPNMNDDQRSPVFIQFLDCVFQLTQQFPAHFEFNECLLQELASSAFSGSYGTFFCNSHQERLAKHVYMKCPSVWSVILPECEHMRNPYYQGGLDILRPNSSIRRLQVWHELFFKWHIDFFYPILRMASVRQHKDIILRTTNSGMELYRKQLAETQQQLVQVRRELQLLQKTS